MYNFMSSTRRLTIASMVIAIYIVVLYITQGISFGAYQIRIATAMYALAYVYPFLVVPLGIANLIANFLFGGLGRSICLAAVSLVWRRHGSSSKSVIITGMSGLRSCPFGSYRLSWSVRGLVTYCIYRTACSSSISA